MQFHDSLSTRTLSVRPRTILVDDHPVFRAGLRLILDSESALDIVGEATQADEALAIAEELRPEIAFVDIHLPGIDGIALTARLRAERPECSVIGLSAIDEPIQIAQMMRAGAVGFVLKTEPVGAMVEAVRSLQSGIRYLPPRVSRDHIESLASAAPIVDCLTTREREVFEQLVEGETNDDIAMTLLISTRTVETHRQRIMSKFGVHTLVQLIHLSMRHGLRRS